jgi:hypothetical protein
MELLEEEIRRIGGGAAEAASGRGADPGRASAGRGGDAGAAEAN